MRVTAKHCLRIVFATLASASLSLLPGCGGGSPAVTTMTTTINTAVPSIYVGNGPSSGVYSVLQFARDAQGSATPIASLLLPSGFEMNCLTTDSTGQIYVGGALSVGTSYTWEVLVYASAASGNAVPVRTIVGSSSSFLTVSKLAVDSSGLLYVLASQPAPMVAVMAASANGMATPLRTITGSATQISYLFGIAVDPSGTVYVSPSAGGQLSQLGEVLAFASTANGNVAPTRVISGGSAGFGVLSGMDTDSSGNLYVLSTSQSIAPGATTIEEFAPTANGNVAPIRTIGGSGTGVSVAGAICIDKSTGAIYVSVDGPSVATFAATASGNAAPATSFTSTAWYELGYYGIALR